MSAAVELEGIGKRYELGTGAGYRTLRETLSGFLTRRPQQREGVWALRDVSLTVEPGTALGIVGRNGAGKTTLLRILARITDPTAGMARTRGRVGALLEVGTGFHPELTGTENIYLGGAVIGMKRREVRERFDEIVEFAGVERFLDTPGKRYSAGMYLRLAFSVAAHLEPEIVVVDEVLAVGDAEFQRRCLGKMAELEREGRTVLFVSHDVGAVAELCDRAIWLDSGRLRREGPARELVAAYLDEALGSEFKADLPQTAGPVVLEDVSIVDGDGRVLQQPQRDDPLRLLLTLSSSEPNPGLDLAIYLIDSRGRRIIDDALSDHGGDGLLRFGGRQRVTVTVPPMLRAGDYGLGVWIGTAQGRYLDREVFSFRLAPRPEDRAEAQRRERAVQPGLQWEIDAD